MAHSILISEQRGIIKKISTAALWLGGFSFVRRGVGGCGSVAAPLNTVFLMCSRHLLKLFFLPLVCKIFLLEMRIDVKNVAKLEYRVLLLYIIRSHFLIAETNGLKSMNTILL